MLRIQLSCSIRTMVSSWARSSGGRNNHCGRGATRVPFIINAPGLPAGASCSQPVELLSIYPTLIDLCQLTPRDGLEGVNLRPLLENPQAKWDHHAITTHGRNNHSVRDMRYRYIRYFDGSEELYDLQEDPREWHNLAGETRYASLKSQLAKSFPNNNVQPAKAASK